MQPLKAVRMQQNEPLSELGNLQHVFGNESGRFKVKIKVKDTSAGFVERCHTHTKHAHTCPRSLQRLNQRHTELK